MHKITSLNFPEPSTQKIWEVIMIETNRFHFMHKEKYLAKFKASKDSSQKQQKLGS